MTDQIDTTKTALDAWATRKQIMEPALAGTRAILAQVDIPAASAFFDEALKQWNAAEIAKAELGAALYDAYAQMKEAGQIIEAIGADNEAKTADLKRLQDERDPEKIAANTAAAVAAACAERDAEITALKAAATEQHEPNKKHMKEHSGR